MGSESLLDSDSGGNVNLPRNAVGNGRYSLTVTATEVFVQLPTLSIAGPLLPYVSSTIGLWNYISISGVNSKFVTSRKSPSSFD